MKVGILTYHWVANFGANLQTLSTVGFFKSNNIDVRIINWVPEDLEKHYEKVASKVQFDAHKQFSKKYFEMTRLCRTSLDIADVIKEEGIDLVVIGSDAVLTYVPFRKQFMLSKRGIIRNKPYSDSVLPNPYWGDFQSKINVKCVLMSASAQNTEYGKTVLFLATNKIGGLLDKMKYISVRDVWTQRMLAFLSHNKIIAPITPDPVFAFNYNVSGIMDEKKELELKERFHLEKKYILFSVDNSILSDEWVLQFNNLATEKGYEVIELPRSIGEQHTALKKKITLPLDPLDWYQLIKYSSGYVGVLMHPLLVSLHNTVPVFSIDTYGFTKNNVFDRESSKIYHIMKRFNLLQHNYYNIKAGKNIPDPNEVMSSITTFDKESCKNMSDLLYLEYKEMMNNILNA